MESKNEFSGILSPFAIKGLELKNRVVFLPHEMYYGSKTIFQPRNRGFTTRNVPRVELDSLLFLA